MIDRILHILAAMKSRLQEFTDGGPGYVVSHRNVQFRAAEIIQLLDLDYFIQFHLASEVEWEMLFAMELCKCMFIFSSSKTFAMNVT